MSNESQIEPSEGIDLSSYPDRALAGPLTTHIMDLIKQSDEAAYRVWLILGNRFGAMQRVS